MKQSYSALETIMYGWQSRKRGREENRYQEQYKSQHENTYRYDTEASLP